MTLKQKYQKELKKLSIQIIEKYKPNKIYLFGSVASGKITKDSDIDLLVVKNTKKDYWQRARELSKVVSNIIDVPKDVLNISSKELENRLSAEDFFIKDIINNGKLIYEKNGSKQSV